MARLYSYFAVFLLVFVTWDTCSSTPVASNRASTVTKTEYDVIVFEEVNELDKEVIFVDITEHKTRDEYLRECVKWWKGKLEGIRYKLTAWMKKIHLLTEMNQSVDNMFQKYINDCEQLVASKRELTPEVIKALFKGHVDKFKQEISKTVQSNPIVKVFEFVFTKYSDYITMQMNAVYTDMDKKVLEYDETETAGVKKGTAVEEVEIEVDEEIQSIAAEAVKHEQEEVEEYDVQITDKKSMGEYLRACMHWWKEKLEKMKEKITVWLNKNPKLFKVKNFIDIMFQKYIDSSKQLAESDGKLKSQDIKAVFKEHIEKFISEINVFKSQNSMAKTFSDLWSRYGERLRNIMKIIVANIDEKAEKYNEYTKETPVDEESDIKILIDTKLKEIKSEVVNYDVEITDTKNMGEHLRACMRWWQKKLEGIKGKITALLKSNPKLSKVKTFMDNMFQKYIDASKLLAESNKKLELQDIKVNIEKHVEKFKLEIDDFMLSDSTAKMFRDIWIIFREQLTKHMKIIFVYMEKEAVKYQKNKSQNKEETAEIEENDIKIHVDKALKEIQMEAVNYDIHITDKKNMNEYLRACIYWWKEILENIKGKITVWLNNNPKLFKVKTFIDNMFLKYIDASKLLADSNKKLEIQDIKVVIKGHVEKLKLETDDFMNNDSVAEMFREFWIIFWERLTKHMEIMFIYMEKEVVKYQENKTVDKKGGRPKKGRRPKKEKSDEDSDSGSGSDSDSGSHSHSDSNSDEDSDEH